MSEAPREFEPINSREEARRLLRDGAKILASAMIWTKEQKQVINTHLSVYSDAEKVVYVWRPKDLDLPRFTDELAALGSRDVFFSVSLPSANLFFKSRYVNADAAGLKFTFPEKVYKVQRRKDVRFTIPTGQTMRVEFNDPLMADTRMSKRILDLSAGGLGFFADEGEEVVFSSGVTLQSVAITLRGRKIETSGEIRHIKKITDASGSAGLKIGVQFKELRPGDAQLIAAYVFDESRKHYAKFIE